MEGEDRLLSQTIEKDALEMIEEGGCGDIICSAANGAGEAWQ